MDFPMLQRDGRDPFTRDGDRPSGGRRKSRYHLPLIVGVVAGVFAAILAAKLGWIR
jgi:hypothetical protein